MDGLVEAAKEQVTAVGRNGDAIDLVGVPVQGSQFLVGWHIPNPEGVVEAAGGKAAAVLEEGHRSRTLRGAREATDLAGIRWRGWVGQPPQARGAVLGTGEGVT